MSQETRNKKLRLKLKAAEADFHELLVASLRKCKDGNRGIFLTESKASRMGDVYPKLVWPEAKELEKLGKEIHSLRGQLGESIEGSLYARYLQYCLKEGANVPGGVKLAGELLAGMEGEEKAGKPH